MDSIPDFTPADIEMVRQLIQQGYQKTTEIHLADSGIMLNHERRQLADCSRLYCRYTHIIGETVTHLGSNTNFVPNQLSIDTGAGNSPQPGGSLT